MKKAIGAMNEETQKILMDCGAFGYCAEKTAILSGLPLAEVEKALKFKDGEIWTAYYSGVVKSDYLLTKKLFEMAQAGDLQAMRNFEEKKKINSRKK